MHSVNDCRRPNRLPLCLVGCGGMGRRHLSGYAALTRAGLWRADLVAVFDVRKEAAEAVADEAERLLGNRPRVHTELAGVLDDENIAALDVVTDPSTHHAIAVPALESGRHTLCEKPLGLTVRACQAMLMQLAYLPAGPGHHYVQRTIHGSAGSMAIPPDRTDGEVEVRRADGVVRGRTLAAELGEAFVLDDTTVALLGPDGTGGGAPFAEVDAGYLGVEIADFVSAVLDGHPPELDGLAGTRAVAGVLAVLESAALGQPVSLDDVLTGAVRSYQDDIDQVLGLATGREQGAEARPA